LIVLIALLAVAGAGGSEEPPLPAWMSSDGTIDQAKAPEFFMVSDETGATVTCADGSPLLIPADEFFAPPPPPPPAERLSDAAARGNILVLERRPSCGPDGTVQWTELWYEEPAQSGPSLLLP
jgi:hypothetical protein